MKKIVSLFLAAMMVLSLAACSGNSGSAPAETTAAAETEAVTEAAAETEAVTEAAAETEAAETEAAETEAAETEAAAEGEETTIVLAAAASLKYVFDDKLIPMFQEANPNIKVEATYDSSGKLQTQIEEGADWDVFFSAGMKQMTALQEAGLMNDDTVKVQVTNELVLIVPKGNEKGIASVQDIVNADTIAIGDPADVPVGQYTQATLEELGLWDAIQEKEISLGTNVTEVLSWVAAGSADCGFTYRTDAIQEADNVEIIEGLAPATYPIGVIGSSTKQEAAQAFIDFLGTDEALQQFTDYGFTLPE